jgi:hypothetical protein
MSTVEQMIEAEIQEKGTWVIDCGRIGSTPILLAQ